MSVHQVIQTVTIDAEGAKKNLPRRISGAVPEGHKIVSASILPAISGILVLLVTEEA